MGNIEIVKKAIRMSTYFNNNSVSDSSSENEVKIVTKKVFIRNSELNILKTIIENLGGNVDDIYVSTMPALNNDLCVVVEFNIGYQNY
jgi:hypothetical protein